jgi:hypothetical protein
MPSWAKRTISSLPMTSLSSRVERLAVQHHHIRQTREGPTERSIDRDPSVLAIVDRRQDDSHGKYDPSQLPELRDERLVPPVSAVWTYMDAFTNTNASYMLAASRWRKCLHSGQVGQLLPDRPAASVKLSGRWSSQFAP